MSAGAVEMVALVTGGGSGIGRACALRIAASGAKVVVADVNAEAAAAVAGEIGGDQAIGLGCDVRDEEQISRTVARGAEAFGPVTGLVTSAGIVKFSQTHETALDAWQQVIDVNLTGTFLAIKHAIPGMLAAGGGAIVTIGSVSALVAANTQADPGYKASKGGVLALTRYVAAQYGGAGIRINCLCPGPIATAIVDDGSDDNAEHFKKLGEGVPLGRGGRPSEIGDVANFLLSPESSYMTGSTVVADGGFTAA